LFCNCAGVCFDPTDFAPVMLSPFVCHSEHSEESAFPYQRVVQSLAV